MEISFLSSTLSLFFLLTISVFVFILSKKINFPYTVLLLLVGLLLVPISKIELFSFINHFELTPEILFYVFLPVLLFESAYNINYRQLHKNWKSITGLAVFWLLISSFLIWWALYLVFPFLGFEIPFLVCLLFGSLISATDPVAVLAIFKSVWAPRRLTLLFEWESLFNDGTALALFLVILWIIIQWWIISDTAIFSWIWTFLSMVIGGFIFWWIFWILFSKVIWYVKNNEMVEITLTMILAHITFLSAEMISHYVFIWNFNVYVSWIIATAIAWIIIWNYWRYKISPKVESHMNQFWEFFAFVSNSLVFILMWLILSHINVKLTDFIIPILFTIIIVIIIRAIAVYVPLWFINFFKLEEKIPLNWQHMLSWGSLRWALALMMALMIPWEWQKNYDKVLDFQQKVWWWFDFDIRDFIIVLTIGSIMFTMFIKATTVPYFMRKMWVSKLHDLEKFEYQEWKILSYLKILAKLDVIYSKKYLTVQEFEELKLKYEDKLKTSVEDLKKIISSKTKEDSNALIRKALSLHALWIEKQYLKDLFTYNEIWEENFKFILNKIDRQIERIDSHKPQLRSIANDKIDFDVYQKLVNNFRFSDDSYIDKYIRNRTKAIITRKVIKELKELSKIDFGFDKVLFEEIIDLYTKFNLVANEKKDIIFKKHKSTISSIESRLADKSLLKLEEETIKALYKKDIITPKLYLKFIEEIENEIYTDIKRVY